MSTWTIEEALTDIVGQKPDSQKIANGILALCHDGMLEYGKSQLLFGIKEGNYPLTEENLCKIFKDVCGMAPDKAKSRAALVFGK